MADTNNLSQFLTDIADAIRTKKETEGQIPAEQFDQEILSIKGGDNVKKVYATVDIKDDYATDISSKFAQNNVAITKDWQIVGFTDSGSASSITMASVYYKGQFKETYKLWEYMGSGYTTPNKIIPCKVENDYIIFGVYPAYKNFIYVFKYVLDADEPFSYLGKINTEVYLCANLSMLTSSQTINTFSNAGGGSGIRYYDNDLLFLNYSESSNPDTADSRTGMFKYDETENQLNLLCGGNTYGKNISKTFDLIMRNNLSSYSYNYLGKYIIDETGYVTFKNYSTKDTDINGVNYFGDKVFKGGNVYELYNDASIGNLIAENVYSPSNYTIECLNDKYYRYGSTVYSFDEENNEFTEVGVNYYWNGSRLYKIVNDKIVLLKFEQGETQIGIEYDDVFYPLVNTSTTGDSDKIVKGYTFYTAQHQPIDGTMSNNGELSFIPSTETQDIPEGYTSGGTVEGDTNLLPENIKKDISIFGVEGVYEGSGGSADVPVKLFETEDEMQADEDAKEGDLAVVYRSEIQNATASSKFSILNFPDTVTLPSVVTSSTYGMLRCEEPGMWADGSIQLSASSFEFQFYGDSNYFTIQYSSTDGITYTRTDDNGNPIDLGVTMICAYQDEWDDNFGYFIQTVGYTFEGLFDYTTNVTVNDKIVLPLFDDISFDVDDTVDRAISNISIEKHEDDINSLDVDKIKTIIKKFATDFSLSSKSGYVYRTSNGIYFFNFQNSQGGFNTSVFDKDKTFLGFMYSVSGTMSGTPKQLRVVKMNLDTLDYEVAATYVGTDINDVVYTGTSNDRILLSKEKLLNPISLPILIYASYNNCANIDISMILGSLSSPLRQYNSSESTTYNAYGCTSKYLFASTQLTLKNSNELLTGKTAYGPKGVITGDGSIYDNLNIDELDTAYMTGLANSDTTKDVLNVRTNIPFGIRTFEPTLEPLNENIVSNALTRINLLSDYDTDITGRIFDCMFDIEHNKIEAYKATAFGEITKYTSDANLQNVVTETYTIPSTEYVLNGKVVDNKIYMITRTGKYDTSGTVYCKVLDILTGSIQTIGTILTSDSYTSCCVGYDDITKLLYITVGYSQYKFCILNTTTNVLTTKETVTSNSVNSMVVTDAEDYIFVVSNSVLYAYKKGTTSPIQVFTNCRPEHIAYTHDDTKKYLSFYNYGDSKKYKFVSNLTDSDFGTAEETVFGYTGMKALTIDNTNQYILSNLVYDEPFVGDKTMELGMSFYSSMKWPGSFAYLTKDSIRIYDFESYSGQNIGLYVNRNLKMKDLVQFSSNTEFLGYCYNENKVIPLQPNYKDELLNSFSMSQEEYEQALYTVDEILGEEE